MDLKQWAGMVAMGVAAIALAVVMNRPTDLSNVPGARAPKAEFAADAAAPAATDVEAPKAQKAAAPAMIKREVKAAAASGGSDEAPSGPVLEGKSVAWKAGEKGPSIKGKITWEGDVPKNPVIQMDSDEVCKKHCEGKEVRAERWVVGEGGAMANVVVYVTNAPKDAKAKTDDVLIDQVGCTYHPHVVALQLGQKIKVKNSDTTTHNVHFKSKLNGDWNMTQSEQGVVDAKEQMKRAELGTALFKCDIHTWMESRVCVFDHPFFAVSQADGSFEIDGLPAGEYTIQTWHEKEKPQTMKLTVKDGATAEANFVFKKAK